jgi:hypothetical protein
MQRILNHPDHIVDEMLKGFVKAHGDIAQATDNPRVIKRTDMPSYSSLQKEYLLGYCIVENIFENEDDGAILESYGSEEGEVPG